MLFQQSKGLILLRRLTWKQIKLIFKVINEKFKRSNSISRRYF